MNGFPAVRLRTSVQAQNGGSLSVLSYFIEKDQQVYVFHGYTDANTFSSYASTFENTFTSFATLTNQSVLNVQPFRLDVFQAPQTGLFSSLVAPNASVGMDISSLAILNQKEESQQISQGTYLKQVD